MAGQQEHVMAVMWVDMKDSMMVHLLVDVKVALKADYWGDLLVALKADVKVNMKVYMSVMPRSMRDTVSFPSSST